jgi:hypothetical protein
MLKQFKVDVRYTKDQEIKQVKCQKSGTMYYQNMKTGQTAWSKYELENPIKQNK